MTIMNNSVDHNNQGAMTRPTLIGVDSGSSMDSHDSGHLISTIDDEEDDDGITDITGMTSEMATPHGSTFSSWNSARPRSGSESNYPPFENGRMSPEAGAGPNGNRHIQRPGPLVRTPSSTYAPVRHPVNFADPRSHNSARSGSATRSRRDPISQYRAQEKAYVQRLRQDNQADYFDPNTQLFYGTESENEEEPSPNELPFDGDIFDNDNFVFGQEDAQPTAEELKDPGKRERLEWHAMLSSVLTGDVVRQEKKRLIGSSVEKEEATLKSEIWMGVRAKTTGRTLADQKHVVNQGRETVNAVVDEVIEFQIRGKDVTEKTPHEQVQDVLKKVEKCYMLYPSVDALIKAKPNANSAAFLASYDCLVAWNNITELVNTELTILHKWVGNEELNFTKPNAEEMIGGLASESSFIDRLLKEDSLKSLVGKQSVLAGIAKVIGKAKQTLIENTEAFQKRHLPPIMDELFTLISFPSRLIEEIITLRLNFARRIKEPAPAMVDSLIQQFHVTLELALDVKQGYIELASGWDIPPCLDENFEQVVLDSLRFHYKLLNWKLGGNKNTFKEAEILEAEWDFCNRVSRYFEGADLETAEQFSSLTSKLMTRLMNSFEKELQKKPEESAQEVSKRYRSSWETVRIRQRKLFRFARVLSQRFENATEFFMEKNKLRELLDSLAASDHFLVESNSERDGVYLFADPSLYDKPQDIQNVMRACLHDQDLDRHKSWCPYVLIVCPQDPIRWKGRVLMVDIKEPFADIRPGRLRLVADGSEEHLRKAREAFFQNTNHRLDVAVEQRANIPKVNQELLKIKKTTFRLSNTIMESVQTVRNQTIGLDCQELIQSCFVFATEFGKRSVLFMDNSRRSMNNMKLMKLAIDWVKFICDDCDQAKKLTFKWAVVALEFAMAMTRGPKILSIEDEDYDRLRVKVAGCMSLMISHFDIMGARSAHQERLSEMANAKARRFDKRDAGDDESYAAALCVERCSKLEAMDLNRLNKISERQALGRVLDDSIQENKSLTFLSSSHSNVTLRWQQGQYVGGGTFGSVYAAINLDTGDFMAVKEIRLQDPQQIPTIVNAIKEEMTVLEFLDHPNVVQYYGIQVHRDKVYLFMEYCSGGSLAQLLEHGRIEDEMFILIYTLQLLEGLGYLHERGIVHRDIKPENILLDHNGVIKYVDFGAAKVIAKQGRTRLPEATKPGLNSMTGTPMYMSPEVIKGENRGRHGSMDIWSLGCVVLEMATGRRPWASLDNEWAVMWNIAAGNPPQLPTPDQLSEGGIDFLVKCFERDPKKRPTAAELLQHPWILTIKDQVIAPGTPSSESGSSAVSSR